MKYLSLFSGIGAPERALQEIYEDNHTEISRMEDKERIESVLRDLSYNPSGDGRQLATCIGYSEIDKYAIKIYEKHFNHKNFGDITKINAEELPDFELVIGGFPCQSFSIAGKRGGFNDTRGTLFFDIARILKAKRPRLLLLENVKGLLSHDKGRTFGTIISTLDELGYDLQWQVLNSKNFGVPQNRERVFIIGHLRGTPRPKVFPFGETNGATKERFEPNDSESEVAQTIRTRYGNGSGSHIAQLNNPTHSNNRIYGTDGISPTINTAQGGNRQPKIIGGLQAHQTPREDGISPTLTSAMGMGGGQIPVMLEPKIRRLTPTECERLQGFPDGWTEGISDTQRYKTLGNSMTVNVMKAILTKLLTN